MLSVPVNAFVTGLNLANILKDVWANVKKYWRFYVPLLLVVVELGTLYGWSNTHSGLIKERVSHQQDVSNFKAAQAAADTKAQQTRDVLQKESKASADEADAKYATLLAQYRANLVRYQASQSGTKSTDYYQLPSTQSGDGSSTSPQLPGGIVISGSDAQICAVNTARLQAVHDWAIDPPKDGTQ